MGAQERQEVEQLIDELHHLPEGEAARESMSARTAWSNLQFREVRAGSGTPGQRTERFEETVRSLDAALGAFGKLVVTVPITEMIAGVGWRLIQGARSAGLIKENPEASLVGRIENVERRLKEIEKELEALRRRSGILIPIGTFEPEPYELLKDIVAVVTPAEDGFDAGFFDANIHASGDNEEEAVRNLKSMILDVFDALRHEEREALGAQARRQMTVLAEFLRAKEQMLTQDDAREIAKKLEAEVRKGREHDIAIVRYKGRHVAQFGIRRASKEKGHDYIPRQLYITAKQCRDLCDCPLTREAYLEILTEKGVI